LIRVCDARWQIEECFAQANGEVGMDHYEVPTWTAWHRFINFCLQAHALLVVLRMQALADEAGDGKKGEAELIALTVPATRRLALALDEPAAQRGFRLSWSHWRRIHQPVAARCHAALHARARSQATDARTILPDALARSALTDAEWERVRLVLLPQQPWTGRRRHDLRTILSGILTVLDTDLSWREMPEAFGKRETAYKQYRLWCDEGRWPHIVAALGARIKK
jgi:hypothetical protein